MAKGLLRKGENQNLWLAEDDIGYKLQIIDIKDNLIDSGEEVEFDNEIVNMVEQAELCNGQFTEVYFYEVEK